MQEVNILILHKLKDNSNGKSICNWKKKNSNTDFFIQEVLVVSHHTELVAVEKIQYVSAKKNTKTKY